MLDGGEAPRMKNTDTARLDWLDANPEGYGHMGPDRARFWGFYGRADQTLREIIDAAMAPAMSSAKIAGYFVKVDPRMPLNAIALIGRNIVTSRPLTDEEETRIAKIIVDLDPSTIHAVIADMAVRP